MQLTDGQVGKLYVYIKMYVWITVKIIDVIQRPNSSFISVFCAYNLLIQGSYC